MSEKIKGIFDKIADTNIKEEIEKLKDNTELQKEVGNLIINAVSSSINQDEKTEKSDDKSNGFIKDVLENEHVKKIISDINPLDNK